MGASRGVTDQVEAAGAAAAAVLELLLHVPQQYFCSDDFIVLLGRGPVYCVTSARVYAVTPVRPEAGGQDSKGLEKQTLYPLWHFVVTNKLFKFGGLIHCNWEIISQ
jgi:hypothetical protein